tara:strand:- start:2422 stop:3297 length:876 start_codon:yes stop_codon:yes gene_type:complete
MQNKVKQFKRTELPFNEEMLSFWNDNGFIIINNFYTELECNKLRNKANSLVKNFNPNDKSFKSTFDTNNQKHSEDKYFLESGDKIRFFFENKAFDSNGNLFSSIEFVINKIGHALHDLDKDFYKFSHREDLNDIAKSLGIKSPKILQSMYIFKQPKIGGEVVCHQDSTFIYTEPESATGFWVALEDATIENGCLWAAKEGHKGPLRKRFKKVNGKMEMIILDNTPFEKTDTPLEVTKGTLVLLHGRLPHYSCENKSNKSRHAYTFHIIDGNSHYLNDNWLQRNNLTLKGFL